MFGGDFTAIAGRGTYPVSSCSCLFTLFEGFETGELSKQRGLFLFANQAFFANSENI